MDESCCPHARSRAPGHWRSSSVSARPASTYSSSAATSPSPAPQNGWWPWRPPTGLQSAAYCTRRGVIEDAALTNITDELIERDWAPKVYGAWNLHTATADQPLDWFCSFSSAAALVGSPGQGAYAAANSWLDAFGLWRRSQGLPGTAIAWGAWGQIGRGTALAEGAGIAIAPDEGAYAFEALLRHDRAYTGYAPITGTPWLSVFAERSPFAEAFRSTGQKRYGHQQITRRTRRSAAGGVGRQAAARDLRSGERDPAPQCRSGPPLSEYGMDSLGALELRTRIENETGIRISATGITTVHGLADLLCEKLLPAGAA